LLAPMSKRDLHSFNRHGNTKPSLVVPMGMDVTENLQAEGVAGNHKLFYIGSLDYIPNQEGLIWFIEHVWTKFLQPSHQYTFYVAGRNAPASLKKYLGKQPLN